jgi:hypothetical protein
VEQWQPVLAAMEYIVCTKEMSVKAKKKAKVAEVVYEFILLTVVRLRMNRVLMSVKHNVCSKSVISFEK